MQPKPERHERQDWAIVLILLLVGFLCVIVAGQWALRLSPSWKLNTDMGSNLDPNSDFLTDKPVDFIVPLDPDILTKPAWDGLFTPGVKFVTRTPLPPPPLSVSTAAVTETGLPATSPVGTSTVAVTNTSTLAPTNTFVWLPLPASSTPKPKQPKEPTATPLDTPVNTPIPGGDLVITMSDGGISNYSPNTVLRYTVTVTNNGTSDANGVLVTDTFSIQIDSVSWSCSPAPICTSSGTTHINDTLNLPAGVTVTYLIDAHISLSAMGPLVNSATVTTPASFIDTNPANNTSADTNADPAGSLNIGPPDGIWSNIVSGGTVTMVISPAIDSNGGSSPDFVFYERNAPPAAGVGDPHVDMDRVRIDISPDGSSWTTVFYWGDDFPDNNTNIPIPVGTWCPTEIDNCHILGTDLYNTTGVTIDIDSRGLSGNYPWISITCPAGDSGSDGCDIDAIEILP